MSSESMKASEPKMIILESSDKRIIKIEKFVAIESRLLKTMIEAGCSNPPIPIPNITGKTLTKIMGYCKTHATADGKDLQAYDRKFIDVDQAELHQLLTGANFLDIWSLVDLCCKTVAGKIKNRTPKEIREYFEIENDFTPEEEKKIWEENGWAFERFD